MSATRPPDRSLLGVGAAACVACCLGPIVAVVGGLSIAGVAAALVVGAVALVPAVVAAAAILRWRRRRATGTCAPGIDVAVPVGSPTRKVTPPGSGRPPSRTDHRARRTT
jgi:hypothetical protein